MLVKVYEALRSTGVQPASLYGLTKVHKKETPLRPVLSIPGSCYHKLNKFLTPFFQKIEGANRETNTNDARKTLEQIKLDKDEQILSLDIKSLDTNVPVKEAGNIALQLLYARDDKPDIPRTTMKRLLKLAVTNVHFKCNENCYCQKDGLAMGASLAVILANLWMKLWEPQLKLQTPKCKTNTQSSTCRNCEHRVTARSRGVEWEVCNRWFHAKCEQTSNAEYDSIENEFWMCSFCRENYQTDINHSSETKVFLRYVDGIVRIVRSDTKELLDAVNNLHPNFQFALETTDDENSLPILDMSINLQPEWNILCIWYKKPSHTGTILNYRSCATLQHKKSIIQGTIQRLFRATSNWEAFHEALTQNEEVWERNPYPRHWVGNIVKGTINQLRMKEQRKGHRYNAGVTVKQRENTEKQQFVLQYRGNISNEFVKKLNKNHPVQTIFTTRKLKSCLPSLKSSFDMDLKSHVFYEFTCNGCKSIYVGQKCRFITTRVAEHAKADSPMGVHAIECNGDKNSFPVEDIRPMQQPI